MYRPPYEEYITNNSDGSLFAAQLYDAVVVRKYRPTLIREFKDQQHALVGIHFFFCNIEFRRFFLSRLFMNSVC